MMESRLGRRYKAPSQRQKYVEKNEYSEKYILSMLDIQKINDIDRGRLANMKLNSIIRIMGIPKLAGDLLIKEIGEVEFLKLPWDDVVEYLSSRLHFMDRKNKNYQKSEAAKKMKEFNEMVVESVRMELNTMKTRFLRSIKTAEDIAETKEMEIEGKFIEEIQDKIMEMHTVIEKLKEVDIEKEQLKEVDIEKEQLKEVDIEKEQLKELDIENLQLNIDACMEKLKELDIEEQQFKKDKLMTVVVRRNTQKRLRMSRQLIIKKKKLTERNIDQQIMNKIKKMIELEYREMMVVEVTEKLKGAEDIMKKVKEAKKEAKIIKKIKNVIEAVCLERMVVEIMRKEADVLNIEEIKESEEENTSSMASHSTSRTKHSKIGTVRKAVAELFDASIERCDFSNIKQPALISSCTKEYGGYTCETVLMIWPELKKIGTKLQGPKNVGEEIKRNLPQSDMIVETPSVHSVGFLSFKISGKWMAKRIHKMLKEGIDTWAPEVFLERAIIGSQSPDIAEGRHMDMLRRRYISRSLTCMLQYCQVHVLNSPHEASHMGLARNSIEIEESVGKVEIYKKAQGVLVPLAIVERKSDRGLGNASKDLEALWYAVEKLNAQWLLYVTPVAKKEYIEMCFSAAKSAGWLSNAPLEPPCATYVGYRSCTIKPEKLVYRLNKARALHKVTSFVLRGDAGNYTARDVLECAIQYTFLKTPRMADCTFDIDEILDEQGDTFLYLLSTQARIRSITNESRNDISGLKNLTELRFGKEDLKMGREARELGFHILELTEVIRASCFAVLPHMLCKYIYNLCEIFNRFGRGWKSKKSRLSLLLCEATSVVMDKCFNLLEITPQSFKNELGVTQVIYGAQLSVERPIDVGRNPPRKPNTRFEPFSIHLHVYPNRESDGELQFIKVFGYVEVADTYGLRSEGWTLTNRPDVLYVELFKRLWTDPIYIHNGGCLNFGNPSSCRSVPFSSKMGIAMGLTAINEKEDDIFPICNQWWDLDFSSFLESNLDGSCGHYAMESEGGQVQLNYILLRDAVDATLEVSFSTSHENLKVRAEIVAYYEGGFLFDCEVVEKTFYTASLFELKSSILKSGPVQLKKSHMAVPRKGSLIIKAYLIEVDSESKILSASCDFPAQTEKSSQKVLEGIDCCFDVNVNWSYVQDDV